MDSKTLTMTDIRETKAIRTQYYPSPTRPVRQGMWSELGDNARIYEGVSRHMRRKISHDIRKGTKQIAAGKTAKLDDFDIVAKYGRLAFAELQRTRYNAAVKDLNTVGMRKDLKKASVIDQAVEGAKAAFDKVFDLSKIVFRRKGVV